MLLTGLLVAAIAASPVTQDPPGSGASSTEVYKRVGDVELCIELLTPPEHDADDERPAIVFFFGGGWNGGTIEQFRPQAEYLASRGMVAALADYRVRSRHGTGPFVCVADGKSAVRWLRGNADRLGIDPERIAAGGGSAGGHVAAATGVLAGLDDPEEDASISSKPDALVLFNPVFDNGPNGYGHARVRQRWREISPLHNLERGGPPTTVFFGSRDAHVPVATAEDYVRRMEQAGARCELHVYEGQPHGFFNRGRNARCYAQTVREMDRFLASLGWLSGEPTIELPSEWALVGGTVHLGDGEVVTDGVVHVIGDRVAAVGPRDQVVVPVGVRRVDVTGRHVAPGLIDTHVHYSQTGWADGRPDALDVRATHPYRETMAANAAHPERFHRAFLAAGVTAVFDVGGYPWTRGLQQACEASADAPHVAAAGALLTPWVPPPLGLADQQQFVPMRDEASVREAVRTHAAFGSAAIKVWFVVTPTAPFEQTAPLVRVAGDEAAKLGLPLIVHATSLATAKVAVEAGAHLLVHSVEDQLVDDDFVAAAKAAGTFYCPTLIVRDGYYQLYGRKPSDEVLAQLDWVHPSIAERVRATATTLPQSRIAQRAIDGMNARRELQVGTMAKNILRLHEAGVPIVLGTDAGNPLTLHGPSVFAELEAMQAAGLSAREVLVAATRDAARAMRRGKDLGLLKRGRVADLVVLAEDPSQDARAWRSLTHVARAGLLRTREQLRPGK